MKADYYSHSPGEVYVNSGSQAEGDAEDIDLPELTTEQKMLRTIYLSGQMDVWAWQQQLEESPELRAHFGVHSV